MTRRTSPEVGRGIPGTGIRPVCGALLAALALLTTALWVPLGHVPVPKSDLWPALGLLAAFVVAEGREIHVEFRRQTFGLTGSDAVLVVGLFFVAPLALLAARAGGGALVLAGRRVSRPSSPSTWPCSPPRRGSPSPCSGRWRRRT